MISASKMELTKTFTLNLQINSAISIVDPFA